MSPVIHALTRDMQGIATGEFLSVENGRAANCGLLLFVA
jgi:hypothetical protein